MIKNGEITQDKQSCYGSCLHIVIHHEIPDETIISLTNMTAHLHMNGMYHCVDGAAIYKIAISTIYKIAILFNIEDHIQDAFMIQTRELATNAIGANQVILRALMVKQKSTILVWYHLTAMAVCKLIILQIPKS